MSSKNEKIDTTGPSRDGHEFHEAWAARKAMQLLLPSDGLIGIAVEGLSEDDETVVSQEAVDVADLTLYYGKDTNFRTADRVEVLQFKYSSKHSTKEFKASDAKKTVAKFARSFRDHRSHYGTDETKKKLFFELVTNRPIYPAFTGAIAGIASDSKLEGDAYKQACQFRAAAEMSGDELREFASKCLVLGLTGDLKDTKGDLRKLLVDWSASPDAVARARLGDIRNMVRKKAGHIEESQKIIRQVDILAALELSDIDELLPCPSSLPDVGEVVKREQLQDAVACVPFLKKPMLIHAEGGVGKTVFLESLCSALSNNNEVVFFDCFGGGAYRSPEDGRHLANRGLLHIVNMLACRGLCDPILPGSENSELLFGTFRKRLLQCVHTLDVTCANRELIIVIDAIDNASDFAREQHQRAFPTQIMESFERAGAIPGVKLIVSSRTHRIARTLGDLEYEGFELHNFTLDETRKYVSDRISDIKEEEIRVAQARSKGVARILEHLVFQDRASLANSKINNPIKLDDLLHRRIEKALAEAVARGYGKKEIEAFLAGLAVLPPPVPLEEYSEAHDMAPGAIESFAADLAPLLDQTEQGMTFRDEPTETLIKDFYGSKTASLERVANNLMDRQDQSVYAARSLPGLLLQLGDSEKLFKLAFDERFPAAISSAVGQRRIRYSRLKAAVLDAAGRSDSNNLVEFLVDLSGVAASDQKGANYILDNPDLVVNFQDADALRRLFEARTKWPGARHARLTIANLLSGFPDEAARHYRNTRDWVRHDLQDDEHEYDSPRPQRVDHAAVMLYTVLQGYPKTARQFIRCWQEWYGFEICKVFHSLAHQAICHDSSLNIRLEAYIREASSEISCIAGALSFAKLTNTQRGELVVYLGKACAKKSPQIPSGHKISPRTHDLSDGLRKASVIAIALRKKSEALAISLRAPHERPGIHTFVDNWSDRGSFPFLFRLSLVAASKRREIVGRDLLPKELLPFAKGIARKASLDLLRKTIKQRLKKALRKERDSQEKNEQRRSRDWLTSATDQFLDYRLPLLLSIAQSMASLWAAPLGAADTALKALIDEWATSRISEEGRFYTQEFNPYFQSLGISILLFAFWARPDLKAISVRSFIAQLDKQSFKDPNSLIQLIASIHHNRRLEHILAEQAVEARELIELEDDVETRSALYAQLARAILPISTVEAAEYFRLGLDQLDAIGSGDYSYTNELLCFASSVKGDELSEKDFHTLTNICELNMAHDEHKFPWGAFGASMSKTAGLRGLAKVSRWHDREKIDLSYTLLPYLTALLKDQKISPEYALSLNRLAEPVELWDCNSKAFGEALLAQSAPNLQALAAEFVKQYLDNNPGIPSPSTLKAILEMTQNILGNTHELVKYLKCAYPVFDHVIDELNESRNYSPKSALKPYDLPAPSESATSSVPAILSRECDPLDEESISQAFERISIGYGPRDWEQEFFDKLRSKVKVNERAKYIHVIARAERLDIFSKEKELERCKAKWSRSSVTMARAFREICGTLLQLHAEDFLSFDRLSGYRLHQIAELTGVSKHNVALELVKIFAGADWTIPSSAWIGLATIIVADAAEGHGQAALKRLLNSSAAKLTNTVADGPWESGLYPPDNLLDATTGLVWQSLASPRDSDRWLAAHSVISFARFGCWEVIDALVERLSSEQSEAFQAPELPFYYLHARLWLLIALARLAHEAPHGVAKYADSLQALALHPEQKHVAIRHFASEALLSCNKAGQIQLSNSDLTALSSINKSPLPYNTQTDNHFLDFYSGRPGNAPTPEYEFHFDYDFQKYNIHDLAGVFSAPGWEVKDLIQRIIHDLDPSVEDMYQKGGRKIQTGQRILTLPSNFHGYGHYLAWHALYLAAGQLLKTHRVSQEWNNGKPWSEWLSSNLLTRRDGLWLSDGMDRSPLPSKQLVMERAEEGLCLTGEPQKLLFLVGIHSGAISDEVVVHGDWKSPDNVSVHISSALVPIKEARNRAIELIEGDPFFVWLPSFDNDDETQTFFNGKVRVEPWIVSPSMEGVGLDENDPLSVIEVERRPYFSSKYAQQFSIRPADPFGRLLCLSNGSMAGRTEAWGRRTQLEEGDQTGVRLLAETSFLRNLLKDLKRNLLVLIKLHRYEQGIHGHGESKFTNTVAVVLINQKGQFEYLAGPANQVKTPG